MRFIIRGASIRLSKRPDFLFTNLLRKKLRRCSDVDCKAKRGKGRAKSEAIQKRHSFRSASVNAILHSTVPFESRIRISSQRPITPANGSCANGLVFTGEWWSYWRSQV